MSLPLDITFRGMESSDFVTRNIREHAEKLVQVMSDVQACRVVVEAPSQHHHHGQPFHVRVELSIPGEDLMVIDREPGRPLQAHEDVYVAIHDAFHAARRRLEENVRKRREERRRREGGNGTGGGNGVR